MDIKHPAIIVDIDGTLSDAAHRQHLVRGGLKNWDKFYDLCYLDPLQNHVALIIRALAFQFRILLVSGRVERTRTMTIEWLVKHKIPYDELFMRPDGNYIEDQVLKEQILDRDILPRFDVAFALDDRDRVVKMWRSRGIPCLQCAEGDF
jgi:uncharacterized HAD superfamily protein